MSDQPEPYMARAREPRAEGERTVWKFPLLQQDWQSVAVAGPSYVRLVDIDPVTGAPAIWVEHEPEGKARPREFKAIGTGEAVPAKGPEGQIVHVGSVVSRLGIVFHVYERVSING